MHVGLSSLQLEPKCCDGRGEEGYWGFFGLSCLSWNDVDFLVKGNGLLELRAFLSCRGYGVLVGGR